MEMKGLGILIGRRLCKQLEPLRKPLIPRRFSSSALTSYLENHTFSSRFTSFKSFSLPKWSPFKERGAKIHAEFLGGSFTCDVYHMTKPHPMGMPTEMKCECLHILCDVLQKFGNVMETNHELLIPVEFQSSKCQKEDSFIYGPE